VEYEDQFAVLLGLGGRLGRVSKKSTWVLCVLQVAAGFSAGVSPE
jgi:hypothetical protein